MLNTNDTPQMGRPAWQPSDDDRRRIEALAAYGAPQHEIAALYGVSVDTLARRCRAELTTGKTKAIAKVAEALYAKATKGDTRAAMFWLERRDPQNWKQTTVVENVNKGQPPNLLPDEIERILDEFTCEELNDLQRIMDRAEEIRHRLGIGLAILPDGVVIEGTGSWSEPDHSEPVDG